jgi:hypothetical protein
MLLSITQWVLASVTTSLCTRFFASLEGWKDSAMGRLKQVTPKMGKHRENIEGKNKKEKRCKFGRNNRM